MATSDYPKKSSKIGTVLLTPQFKTAWETWGQDANLWKEFHDVVLHAHHGRPMEDVVDAEEPYRGPKTRSMFDSSPAFLRGTRRRSATPRRQSSTPGASSQCEARPMA